MTQILRLTKLEAAIRQLRRAIRMHFTEDEPVCVHTLAGAASALFADLVKHQSSGLTWEQKAQEANDLTATAFFKIARHAQNFLKHADKDPTGVLDFNPSDTDALLALAVLNASELGPLPPEAGVFQLWSLAILCPDDEKTESPYREAIEYFGDLRRMPRSAQLAAGFRGLREHAGR